MSTIEPPLTDAELRYVRAAVKLAASYKTAAGTVVECDREQFLPYIEAAIAALPAPTPEPEIVAEAFRNNYFTIRRGNKYWCCGEWRDNPSAYDKFDADAVAEALRASEKAAKRPRIEVVKGRYNWGVECRFGDMVWCWYGGDWLAGPVVGGTRPEPEARAIAAKLEAEGNYPKVYK